MSTLKDTEGEDHLDANSPLSSSQSGKNPFRVDDLYFDEFSAKLNNMITNLEEIEAEAPFLSSIPKYNPFDVPTGYFDELPAIMQELTATKEPRFSIKEWLLQLIRPNFAIPVAVTIIIAIAAINLINKQVQQSRIDATADLSLEEQLYPIDETTLVDMLSNNGEDNITRQVSGDENIADYLLDNNVDEATLRIDLNTAEK
jgi:hypothetical protein